MKHARQYNTMWAVLAGLSLLAIQGGHNSGSSTLAQTTPPATVRQGATGTETPPATGTTAQPRPAAPATNNGRPAAAPGTTDTTQAPVATGNPQTPAATGTAQTSPAQQSTTQGVGPCHGNCATTATVPTAARPLDNTARLPLVEVAAAATALTLTKKNCEEEESSLKTLECLVENLNTNPTREDRNAFITFVLGTTDVERCHSGDTEEYREGGKYEESGFRDAVDTDPKEARKVMAAFRKGIDKLTDNKSKVFCHGMNIARIAKTETVRKTLEARLTNIDRQIEVARARGDLSGLRRAEELMRQRANIAAQYARFDIYGNPRGGVMYEYDRIFSRTAADYFRVDREAYDMDMYGERGAFDDVYSWLRDISVGQSPEFYYDTRVAGRNHARDQWYRTRVGGYGGRSDGFTGEIGRTPPAYGSSALAALLSGRLPGTMNSYLPATRNLIDQTYRGTQMGGRPLGSLTDRR